MNTSTPEWAEHYRNKEHGEPEVDACHHTAGCCCDACVANEEESKPEAEEIVEQIATLIDSILADVTELQRLFREL